jgi:AraC family transcriptional regulator
MEWLERMTSAMDYVESRLAEEIEIDEVAKIACCSQYHFQRMFSFIAGIPLSEYIRRRRLTLAAFDLQNSQRKVIEVALKYGYESPEAFARAFKILHGVTPRAARSKTTTLKAYPRMTFHVSIKGDVEMDYRIESKEAFEMFGVTAEFNTDDEHQHTAIPRFWDRCIEDGTMDRIREVAGITDDVWCHGSSHSPVENGFSYTICYHVPENGDIPDEFDRLSSPAQTWAIFSTAPADILATIPQIQNLWGRIYTEWFPTSGYEHGHAPNYEMYYRVDSADSVDGNIDHLFCEIWIPVEKMMSA